MNRALTFFPPGDFLRVEIVARGWTRAATAERMGCTVEVVNAIIGREQDVTPEIAEMLSAAFWTSAQFWLNLQAAYDSWRGGAAAWGRDE